MCKDCGCGITEADNHHHHYEHLHGNPQLNDEKTIEVITKILDKNDHQAEHNRASFDANGVMAINLMSSPGSGKTSLLETIAGVADFRFGVIEGDLETNNDAQRIQSKGIPAFEIQTGSACHLDAFMVKKGIDNMPLDKLDICFIENVGNLVCPASYDVGAHLNFVLVSVPEGEDKVEKYPVMFSKADLVLITKTDLLPYFDYDIGKVKAEARRIRPNVDILEVSVKNPETIRNVASWIEFKRKLRR